MIDANMSILENNALKLFISAAAGYTLASLLFHRNYSGVSIPTRKVQFRAADGKLNINRFPKIGIENMTRGHITKKIITYEVPLRVGDISLVAPFSVGVSKSDDLLFDVFPLEYLIKNNYEIEINATSLKISPGTSA